MIWIRIYWRAVARWACLTSLVAFVLFAVINGVASENAPLWNATLLINLFAFLAAEPILISGHELGHALVACGVGLRLVDVSVGVGASLFTFRLRGAPVRFGVVPGLGFACSVPTSTRWLRLRSGLMIAAGPMTSAVLAVALRALGVALHGPVRWAALVHQPMPFEAAALCAWLHAVSSLLPVTSATSLGATQHDGLRLLKLPFLRRRDLEAQVAGAKLLRAMANLAYGDCGAKVRAGVDKVAERHPNTPFWAMGQALLASRAGDHPAARTIAQKILDRPEFRQQYELFALNAIAWSALMIGDEALLPEALHASAKAEGLAPKMPAVRSTRGAVLVWAGRVGEGRALLRLSLAAHPDRRSRAEDAALLALAEARLGRWKQSRQWLSFARAQDRGSQALPLAERAFAAAPAPDLALLVAR